MMQTDLTETTAFRGVDALDVFELGAELKQALGRLLYMNRAILNSRDSIVDGLGGGQCPDDSVHAGS